MGVRIPPPVQNIKNIYITMFKYITESFEELKSNVTWPKSEEVQKYTIVVAVFSICMAILTHFVDLGFNNIMNTLFGLLTGKK
jgi:preprotein translocase subunit SecE